MNKTQVQAISGVMRFLTSEEFNFPNHVRDLINSCTIQLKNLEEAKVDTDLREEVYNIFNNRINCYL